MLGPSIVADPWGEWECHTSCTGNQMAGLKSLQLRCLAAYSSAHTLQLRPHPSEWLFSTASMVTAHCLCVLNISFRQGLEELEHLPLPLWLPYSCYAAHCILIGATPCSMDPQFNCGSN